MHFHFVTYDQVLAKSFFIIVLILMSSFINQNHAMIYGFIFGFLYDIMSYRQPKINP
ncbi:rod shape-determining protein MreD [Bacillus subtilis]|nr:rod shape-determining protein MreD [Bacillus subtilis]MDI6567171.1 rod shape-determining protein MreD [Bacillus subtilis]